MCYVFTSLFSEYHVFNKTASLATTLQKCEGYKGLFTWQPYDRDFQSK